MIVLLTTEGQLSDYFIAGLAEQQPDLVVIREKDVSSSEINVLRVKKLGLWRVYMMKFASIPMRIMSLLTRKWRKEVISAYPFTKVIPETVTQHFVKSVNDEACISLLKGLNPSRIAVFSTRILKKSTLNAINAPFINYHCGINPKYRGQFPLWWSLALGDEENCGVTVHLVDEGVDTGDVLFQEKLTISRYETSGTQFFSALPIGVRLMNRALREELKPYKVNLPSQIFFPPTLFQYLYYGLRRFRW